MALYHKLTVAGLILLTPTLALAEYTPLVGLPYVNGNQDIGSYVNALYLLAIAVAAFLAVIKIIFGGVNYMLSDVVTDKGQAKKDIKGALLGLLIVLAAVLVLNTINPSLTNLDVLRNAERMSFTSTGSISLGPAGGWGSNIDGANTDATTRNDICSQSGGCTRLTCGSIGSWGPTMAGSELGNSVGDCQARCNYWGGQVVAMDTENLFGIREECVAPTTNVNTSASNNETCLAGGGSVVGGTGQCRMTQSECNTANGSFSGLGTFSGFANEGVCTFNINTQTTPSSNDTTGTNFDTSQSYTIDDAGAANNNNTVTLIQPHVESGVLTGYTVHDSSNNRDYFVGCNLLNPLPPGCF